MNEDILTEMLRKLKKSNTLAELDIEIDRRIPEAMPPFQSLASRNQEKEVMYVRRLEAAVKSAYQSAGMFSFVSWKWVNPLVDWIGDRKCLEVMAGRGWLSYALRQKKVNLIATDNYSWYGTDLWNIPLTDIRPLDAVDAVLQYGKEIDLLICSWPWLDNTMFQVAKNLFLINPDALILYIGEGWGGITADDQFHTHFFEIEDAFMEKKVKPNYESWTMHHDQMYIGRFNPKIN